MYIDITILFFRVPVTIETFRDARWKYSFNNQSLRNRVVNDWKRSYSWWCKASPYNNRSKRPIPLKLWMTPGLLRGWSKKDFRKAYKPSVLSTSVASVQRSKLCKSIYIFFYHKPKSLYCSQKIQVQKNTRDLGRE